MTTRTQRTAQRRARVLELRATGLTYAQIGKQLGFTAERARQLAKSTTADRLTARRREIEEHARVINSMLAAGLLE